MLSPCFRASGPGQAGVVRLLLADDNTIVDSPDRYGNTALHTAMEEERAEVALYIFTNQSIAATAAQREANR